MFAATSTKADQSDRAVGSGRLDGRRREPNSDRAAAEVEDAALGRLAPL